MTTSDANTSLPIRGHQLTKRFGKALALDDVSFEVPRGEVFGLLGPNGAGKTTLIRMVLDIIKPDSGRVELFGRPFQPDDRNRIGYLPEERGLYPRQPIGAVLEYLGMLKGMTATDARRESAHWLERFGLADRAREKVEALSKGNQQKVQVASALLAQPPIVIFDEPLSGLDPVSARTVIGIIRECAAAGQTVVLSTHQMGMVETLCTRLLMLARGRVVLEGAVREVRQRFSADNVVRVISDADYQRCPLVERAEVVDGVAELRLRPSMTSDDLLEWLVAASARVERFERLSTPLEDIFVRVAQTPAETV
jgi:ABC-2 type transport system ATP-binding protein